MAGPQAFLHTTLPPCLLPSLPPSTHSLSICPIYGNEPSALALTAAQTGRALGGQVQAGRTQGQSKPLLLCLIAAATAGGGGSGKAR